MLSAGKCTFNQLRFVVICLPVNGSRFFNDDPTAYIIRDILFNNAVESFLEIQYLVHRQFIFPANSYVLSFGWQGVCTQDYLSITVQKTRRAGSNNLSMNYTLHKYSCCRILFAIILGIQADNVGR